MCYKMKSVVLFTVLIISGFANAKTPIVTLRYSAIFDQWCTQQNGIAVKDVERNRLVAVLPTLQSEWDKIGPALLEKTESIVGRIFQQNEMIGTVFLCKKTPSMSMPLLINGNWFVADSPAPMEMVADIIYHELIHTYLVDGFQKVWPSSKMLKKYQIEDRRVLSHLHLMAIQKKVYLELGLNDRIEKVIKFDTEVYKGAYARSWEIVNSEGEDKFIEELR